MRHLLFPLAFAATLAFSLQAAPADSLRPWREYRTIIWVGESPYKSPKQIPLFFQRLHELGINTAMVSGDGSLEPLLENQFPYYVENIVNRGLCLKWNSNVTDWDKFVTQWAKSGRPESALIRDYCLDDPKWRSTAREQVQRVAAKNRPHQPLAYDLRDELSTTISANPFDYDFNPIALDAFREWLKSQYRDLASLNAEWQTEFASWTNVRPFSTDEIKNRMASNSALPRGKPDWQAVQASRFDPATAATTPTRWNFSPWADFRTYMDLSLARALEDLRQAARATDPHTPVGIEGTQMPHAFGGYDLWRLSQALDWIEPYDIGNAREILGSFMPDKPILTTVFEKDTRHASRRLWHLLLEGDRGSIIWWSEDCFDWASPDCRPTPKALALAPVLKELTSPLARLFLRAKPERDPLYLHYSQPSIQVDWLLESIPDGSTWLRRFSSFEAEHNRLAKTRNAWLKLLQDLGYSPQFVSSEQIEQGALIRNRAAVLVLPASLAISDPEAAAIQTFFTRTEQPQPLLLGNEVPGLFDQHGKLRAQPVLPLPLGAGAGKAFAASHSREPASRPGEIATHLTARLASRSEWTTWLSRQMPVPPTIRYDSNLCVRVHRYSVQGARLFAFERNIDYHMSEELKQAGGNEALEKSIPMDATLPEPAHLYDLMTRTYLGLTNRIHFTLDPWHPSLFAASPQKLPSENIVERLLPAQ